MHGIKDRDKSHVSQSPRAVVVILIPYLYSLARANWVASYQGCGKPLQISPIKFNGGTQGCLSIDSRNGMTIFLSFQTIRNNITYKKISHNILYKKILH